MKTPLIGTAVIWYHYSKSINMSRISKVQVGICMTLDRYKDSCNAISIKCVLFIIILSYSYCLLSYYLALSHLTVAGYIHLRTHHSKVCYSLQPKLEYISSFEHVQIFCKRSILQKTGTLILLFSMLSKSTTVQ